MNWRNINVFVSWVVILFTFFHSFVESMDNNNPMSSMSTTISSPSTTALSSSTVSTDKNPIMDETNDINEWNQKQRVTFTKIPVLILDVDNTFYNENKVKQLQQSSLDGNKKLGIEEQIVKNTHTFCQSYLNMTANECDELYHLYGSTPEGLRVKCSNGSFNDRYSMECHTLFEQFYNQVFDAIHLTSLLRYSHHTIPSQRLMDNSNTGYTHESSTSSSSFISYSQRLYDLLKQIKNIQYQYEQQQHPIRIYLASNSPYKHIYRILQAMGLSSFEFDGIVTPDSPFWNRTIWNPIKDNHNDNMMSNHFQQHLTNTDTFIPYPTKAIPRSFFQPILDRHSPTNHTFILMDDSYYNLQKAKKADIGIDHIVHIHDKNDLCNALETLRQHLETSKNDFKHKEIDPMEYQFSEETYLISKNIVDAQSIHRGVWKQVQKELISKSKQLNQDINDEPITIVDLGAGLLSILELFMNDFPTTIKNNNEKDMIKNDNQEDGILDLLPRTYTNQKQQLLTREIIYYAYEPNSNLLPGCRQKLDALGFQETSKENDDHIYIYHHKEKNIYVYLIMHDFRESKTIINPKSPDLIVGCCFADLFANPRELISSILQLTNVGLNNDHIGSSTLLYFPITFAGTTLLHPPQPFGMPKTHGGKLMIPSDTLALRFYSNTLSNIHQHNLNPNAIIHAVQDFGGYFLSSAPSDWKIDPSKDTYLWDTMRYFFESVIGNIQETQNWNIQGWLHRIKRLQPTIVAKNVDLLFRFDSNNGNIADAWNGQYGMDVDKSESKNQIIEEIEFVSPNYVHCKKIDWGQSPKTLDSNEVEGLY